MTELLRVENLRIRFEDQRRDTLEGVSLTVDDAGWTGLVGESGSGKSMTALAIMGLLPGSARVAGGRITFLGRDLLTLSPAAMREVRGREIGMVFQNPRSALNPFMNVGRQIARAAKRRGEADPQGVARRLVREVGIADPDAVLKAYAHQLSGGMCQRVLIATILALRPRLLIADEPTTALDVTVQAQILDLLHEVQESVGSTVLLISHDLGVIGEHCENVAVMYGGSIVERGTAIDLFTDPCHPYSAHLLRSQVRVDRPIDFASMSDHAESLSLPDEGCRYASICPYSLPACRSGEVALKAVSPSRAVACVRHHELRLGVTS